MTASKRCQALGLAVGRAVERADERGARRQLELAVGDLRQRELRRQHLALLGDLQAPGHRARRLGADRRVARPAAAADGAAAAVEELPRDAVLAHDRGHVELRAVDVPARRDVADVLVGVRVADHDLLLADGVERRAVDRRLEQRADRVRRLGERVAGLEQRHDAQLRADAAGSRQPDLLHEQQHLEQVGRAGRVGDDVGADRAGMRAAQEVVDHAERLDDLARRGAEAADVERDQRPAVGDLALEDRDLVGLGELGVVLLHAEVAEDLGDRGAVHVGVLAHVEQREVKAEHLDLADDVAQRVLGDERRLLPAQRLLGDAQVGEQLRGAPVAAGLALARRAGAGGDELEQAPVGLLGGALARLGGDVGEALVELVEQLRSAPPAGRRPGRRA